MCGICLDVVAMSFHDTHFLRILDVCARSMFKLCAAQHVASVFQLAVFVYMPAAHLSKCLDLSFSPGKQSHIMHVGAVEAISAHKVRFKVKKCFFRHLHSSHAYIK